MPASRSRETLAPAPYAQTGRKAQGRVMVTGASGLLGANFALTAAARWPLTALDGRHAFRVPGMDCRKVDLSDDRAMHETLADVRPATIVHLAAITHVDWCEDNPVEAGSFNVDVTRSLASWAAANDCRMVFMSTDSVFDGVRGGYLEGDPGGPVNAYAWTKLRAEEAVRAANPHSLIIRANFYGWNAQPKQSLAEWFLDRLESGQRVPGFADVIFSPLLANSLSDILCDMIDREAAGTFHVASSDWMSKYQFARAIAGAFGLDPELVERAEMGSASLRARRPANTSLRSARLQAELGVQPPSIRSDLARFKALRDSGHAARLKAACT